MSALPLNLMATELRFVKPQGLEQLPKQTVWAMTQDHNGLIWFGNDAGLYQYDGYKIRSIDELIPDAKINSVRTLVADKQARLWIGTKGNGLFQIANNNINHISFSDTQSDFNFISAMQESVEGLWFGTYNNLGIVDSHNAVKYYSLPGATTDNKKASLTSIVDLSDKNLLLTTTDAVYIFNKQSYLFTKLSIQNSHNIYINSAYKDIKNQVWLATNQGLFLKTQDDDDFLPFKPELINFKINTIVIDEKNIWLGTITQGLVRIENQGLNSNDLQLNFYQNDKNNSKSIPGNSVVSLLLLEKTGTVFISDFLTGISHIDTNSLEFGILSATKNGIHCTDSTVFYDIDIDENSDLWIATLTGLVQFNPSNNICINHNLSINNELLFTQTNPRYSFIDSSNTRWLTTSNGIYKMDPSSGLLFRPSNENLNKYIYFMTETNPQSYILGTTEGLYRYKQNLVTEIKRTDDGTIGTVVFHFIKESANRYYLATNKGLAVLEDNDKFTVYHKVQNQLPTTNILSMSIDQQQDLWVGTDQYGLYQFNKKGDLINHYGESNGIPAKLSIFNIIATGDELWMSTDNGLLQLNTKTGLAHNYHESDGLQGELYFIGSAAKSDDGKLYFGGPNGLNAFYPSDIKTNGIKPKIALTQFTRFGKEVQANVEDADFILPKPINELDLLTLSHKDYVIGFEFAVLDYADPSRNQYAYQMEGLDPDWNYTTAENRTASYTNLKAGDYIFKVKGANKDGIWNETGKQLKIKVYPAPWLSWWAYTLYVLTFFLLLFGYLYRKNKANARITLMLRDEVDRQTKQIQEQKLTVENLLDRKNELFANVSHEFRTPLTLILGPINKLLDSNPKGDDLKSLQMVNRNANRLLTMIEQILQLAKLNDVENITYVPQQVHTQVEIIVESFQLLASSKKISLILASNDEAAINGTQDIIDNILGNLLSNAIKYTQTGGTVTVNSQLKNNILTLSVTDTGCGLDEQQQKDIFNRFERLEAHHDIAGVGIGLSLVAEIVKINNGHINVTSQPGKGSCFAVSLDNIELSKASAINNNKTLIDQFIKESMLGDKDQNEPIQFIGNQQHPNLLIIDDNKDMREHIADSLKQHYYCMLANRGKAGIALAIKHVPEIIICDVMMPEMDGFQVSRVLRSDSRTSHIPLILLTALNDKKSRIKGWRENIDVYLTKPFDAQELLLQLENILVIRNILKKKAHAAIRSGKVSMNSGLPKLDQKFLDKFIGIIEDMYSNPNFLRPQMASMMAVSERQLQRKIKALIDKNPLDLLREYRLKKAAEILKEGYQVSITADKCGFNSVTYFSKCFKQQYGITPKEYQSTCNS